MLLWAGRGGSSEPAARPRGRGRDVQIFKTIDGQAQTLTRTRSALNSNPTGLLSLFMLLLAKPQ
jgi:hypothetical protein